LIRYETGYNPICRHVLGRVATRPGLDRKEADAQADGAPPNAHGLCTAAANGQKNGQPWQNGAPAPFENLHSTYLEQAANESNSDTENTRSDIVQDCQSAGVPIGGQG
jgi:hypothetical protein